MKQRVLILGAGFAGMWSALAAARLLDCVAATSVEITVLAPEPFLHVRPRFYEVNPAAMKAPLSALFEAVGVHFIQGVAERILVAGNAVEYRTDHGIDTIQYDRLILATGSQLFRPAIPGLREHSFSIDTLNEAVMLESHLPKLAQLPDSPARNAVVIVGGGLTGIEIASEMPARLRAILGKAADVKVVVLEAAPQIGPDLGPGPRPVITQALRDLGVTWHAGSPVSAVDSEGVQTANGLQIAASTVICTAGMRASALTEQLASKRDALGRLPVTADLRVVGADRVFAAGDVAYALTDDEGHHALMSCQHALILGRAAGHNAVADLLGLPAHPYRQVRYGTCLDLGPWGAVITEGWAREVQVTGADAKALKRDINTKWIYPPNDRAAAFAAADPAFTIGLT